MSGPLDQNRANYGIRMTVTDHSIGKLAEGIESLCKETNCRSFQVEPAFAEGRASRDSTALSDYKRFSSAFLQAHDIAAEHSRHLYYSGARPWLITNRFCESPYNSLVVTPEGKITSCFEVVNGGHPLSRLFFHGKVTDTAQISQNAEARHHLLDKIGNRRNQCRDCFCFWHCAGDCPAKVLTSVSATPPNHSTRCRLNRTITRELIARYMAAGRGIWRGARGNQI